MILKGCDKVNSTIVGRFAPSPSGRMHLGNAFCYLLAWLSARSQNGSLVLRIEDLDRQRCTRAYAELLISGLTWLGLDWDYGPGRCDNESSYYQSCRDEIYDIYFAKLRDKNLIYPCFCSRNELLTAEAPHLSDGRVLYGGNCRNLSTAQIAQLSASRKPAWRLRVPYRTLSFMDRLCGPCSANLAHDWGDVIVRRSDGMYAYQLAVVIDDALMGVNEIVRGRDLLTSTPLQLYLSELLGFAPPHYLHVPLLVAPDGHKLSKRDNAPDLGTLRARHLKPEQIIGLLAYWAKQLAKPEPISAKELLTIFDAGKLPRADIVVREQDYKF